jgi:uncharacterized protein YdeI (YjbR/CyaY-like superfamily)
MNDDPQLLAVPPELADILDEDSSVRRSFERLSYAQQRRFVVPIAGARRVGTRERRAAEAVELLRARLA